MEKFKDLDNYIQPISQEELDKIIPMPKMSEEDMRMASIHFICTKLGINTNSYHCRKICKMCDEHKQSFSIKD